MKKITLFLVAFFSTLLVMPAVTLAQSEASETIAETTIQTTTSKRADRVKELRTNLLETQAERVAKYKASLAEKLDATAAARLKARCKAAQTLLTAFLKRSASLGSNRTKAYGAIYDKLTNVATRLNENGQPELASEVTVVQARLQEKTDAVLAAIADWEQTLNDAEELDCEADPEAFKSALEQARTTRADVAAKSAAARSYVTETVVPLLKTIKTKVSTTE